MNQHRANGSPVPSPTGYAQPASSLTHAASFSSQSEANSETGSAATGAEKQVKSDSKYFFQPRFAKLGVKGNFMPLAAQPANADLADWLAHQSELHFGHLQACCFSHAIRSRRELSRSCYPCQMHSGDQYQQRQQSYLQCRNLSHNDRRPVSCPSDYDIRIYI